MRIKNFPSVESIDGSQDALVIEQTDGSEDKSRKVSPAQLKQYVQTGNFEATGEVKDGHGNILADMAKSADVDAEIGDLSQTGLTGDSVAEQLGTALNQIIGLQTSKLTLVESKETSSGDSLTFDTTLQNDTMYLVAMSAPVSAASRRMRCSMIRTVNTTTNEIYFGSPDFTVSVSALKLSISCSEVRYGLRATLIKLM